MSSQDTRVGLGSRLGSQFQAAPFSQLSPGQSCTRKAGVGFEDLGILGGPRKNSSNSSRSQLSHCILGKSSLIS